MVKYWQKQDHVTFAGRWREDFTNTLNFTAQEKNATTARMQQDSTEQKSHMCQWWTKITTNHRDAEDRNDGKPIPRNDAARAGNLHPDGIPALVPFVEQQRKYVRHQNEYFRGHWILWNPLARKKPVEGRFDGRILDVESLGMAKKKICRAYAR